MSVPPDRMAPRNPATPTKDPTKIMGVKKPIFWAIIVAGLLLAFYIWRKSKSTKSSDLQSANAGTEPDTTNGVTAADIGGTPADNSFATNTDLTAIEEQIQQLQNALFQLQQSNGGNGAGIGHEFRGSLGSSLPPPSPPNQLDTNTIQKASTLANQEHIAYFGPGGGGIYTGPPIGEPVPSPQPQ